MQNKINELLKELTLEEKAALCSGVTNWRTTPINRLNIPSVLMTDGPHGVRKEIDKTDFGNVFKTSVPSTCFPPAVTLAATWDKALVADVGKALGNEAIDQGVDTLLGPGVNIKRNPMCGRNFEYFSEDPLLAGELGAAYVNGLQSTGVGASLKHFAVNSQEYRRLSASSEVDERALREIYLSAFERIVKEAQPKTVMCSYNPINGVYASDNKRLLSDILRDEWGYKGIVISDWGAVNDRVEGIKAGMDLEMPSSNGIRDYEIVNAVNAKLLSEEALDKVVARILDYVLTSAAAKEQNSGIRADYAAHHHLARKVAAEGTVLLKNDKDLLPMQRGKKIAVIGELAKVLRSQGTGSSKLNPNHEVSFLDCLRDNEVEFDYEAGYTLQQDSKWKTKVYSACKAVLDKDYVLVFVGLTDSYESESFDRTNMDLPMVHNYLIDEITKYNDNVIVVLTGGSPVTMPWLNKVKAVVNVYLGGEAGGEATYDVLFGFTNPSGKLPETYPLSINDVMSTHYFDKEIAEYRESIFVGYRYFDTAKKDVLFPFGYGLSYTKFEYSDLTLSSDSIDENEELKVSFKVKNAGTRDGAEVVQLYVHDVVSTAFMAKKQLKAFDKVFIKAGESANVEFVLNKAAFAFYNTKVSDWTVESGEFELLVGSSSADIKLRANVNVDAAPVEICDTRETMGAYYDLTTAGDIPLAQFEVLLGRKVNEISRDKRRKYGFNTVIGDLDGTLFCRLFRWAAKKLSVKLLPKNATLAEKRMTRQGAMDLPIRNFYALSNGAVPYDACTAFIEMCNGKTFKGLVHIIKAFNKKNVKKADLYKC